MVSVKRFVQDEPALMSAAKGFVTQFSAVEDPVVSVARRAKSLTSRIAWVLLGTVLFQDRDYSEIRALLNALYTKFPDEKLWSLPVPTGLEIEAVVESTFGGRNWSLFEHVAGIFWSVGLFVRHHPNLVDWACERTPEEMWRDLGEIYFMGKSNPRPKACAAIYRIIAQAPLGLGVVYRESRKMPPLPLTMGARRFLAILGPAREVCFADLEASEKQKMATDFFVAANAENPYAVAHALQFFLEEGCEDFICRERTRHCAECPLYEFCNYAEHRR